MTDTSKPARGKPAPKAASSTKPASAAKARSVAKAAGGKAFSAEEMEAMKERAAEMKSARGGKADGEAEVLAKIAAMAEPDRRLAERIHAIVKATAPELEAKTWYGMPAYAKDGKTICFFQDARKFKTRYATLGFSDKARLDDGNMWPNSYALTKLTPADEARIVQLIKTALG